MAAKGPDSNEPDEPQPAPEPANPAALAQVGLPKNEREPFDEFVPAVARSDVQQFADERGAKILLVWLQQARHEERAAQTMAAELRGQLNAKVTECHELKVSMTRSLTDERAALTKENHDLHVVHTRVADRLRQLRRESWIVPFLTLIGGVLLSTYWKLADNNPARPFVLFGGLITTAAAVILLFTRKFSAPDDEHVPSAKTREDK